MRRAIAVSGGPDSLCLAWLAAQRGTPLALIVDHGLRSESAREAAQTADRLASFGVESRILTLTGLAPGPGLAARARAARYAALSEAARAAGCVELMLGHHRRDQAETLLMRQRAGSGPDGMAGMAAVSETAEIQLLRPLLGTPPGELRRILRAAGLSWVEDPSNRSPAALRSRLRDDLADDAGDGPRVAELAALAARYGEARAAADVETAAILAARVAIHPEGYALLTPGPIPARALAALIRTIGGNPYPETSVSLARVAAAPAPCVIGGVRFMRAGRLGDGLLVSREAAAMAPPVAAAVGAVWDGRFRVEALTDWPEAATLGAVGDAAPALRAHSDLPAAVLRTLPALRVHDRLVCVPFIGYPGPSVSARLVVHFAPSHPLAGAPFGVFAGGCEEAGEPPC